MFDRMDLVYGEVQLPRSISLFKFLTFCFIQSCRNFCLKKLIIDIMLFQNMIKTFLYSVLYIKMVCLLKKYCKSKA